MLELLLVLLLAVPLAAFAAVAGRRRLLQRGGGTVDLALRLRPGAASGGWVAGVGRFVADELQWYRVFSIAPRPRRTLSRGELRVQSRRPPQGPEVRALHAGSVVLCCTSGDGPVELAMEPAAVTGFLAWLEARPPGLLPPP